eukprot:scaffold89688_cov27-Tisochrysis_lutea.AAC.1
MGQQSVAREKEKRVRFLSPSDGCPSSTGVYHTPRDPKDLSQKVVSILIRQTIGRSSILRFSLSPDPLSRGECPHVRVPLCSSDCGRVGGRRKEEGGLSAVPLLGVFFDFCPRMSMGWEGTRGDVATNERI